jgi:glycosyltransferase involved in cell wall biosynthesis
VRLPSIHYVSHFWASGYGTVGRRLMLALHDLGVPVRWSPVEFDEESPLLAADVPTELELDGFRQRTGHPDLVVLHTVPELLPALRHLRPPGSALVLHTVWEHEVLQPHWPALINQFDCVVVPTEWNAEAFRSAGVRVPVVVVPHIISTDQGDAGWLEAPPISVGDAFLAHTIATWTIRKDPSATIEAFVKAFTPDDNALLVARTETHIDAELPSPPGPASRNRTTAWTTALLMHRHHPAARVHLATEPRSFSEVQGLHERSDCWLSLPRAEGWNLGAFDAASAGTPVITTAQGGPLEYLQGDAHLLIPGRTVPLEWLPGATWMKPDVDAAVDALRSVHADPGGYATRAANHALHLRANYAPSVVAHQFLDALADVGIT